jgi:3,4-dihydroxy 2-butanone 4-phosphate synthase / GTP cyclohydrolase II
LITKVAVARLPMEEYGEFTAHCYISHHDKAEHLVLTRNLPPAPDQPVLVRMHSERKLGDLFLKSRDESRNKLMLALKKIQEHGSGALVYIRKHKKNFLSAQIQKMRSEDSNTSSSDAEK